MTHPMQERMRTAICNELGYDYDSLYANKSEWIRDRGSRHDINTPYKGDIDDAAIAALQALREPTEDMVEDGQLVSINSTAFSKDVFTAMIDAVLKEAEDD